MEDKLYELSDPGNCVSTISSNRFELENLQKSLVNKALKIDNTASIDEIKDMFPIEEINIGDMTSEERDELATFLSTPAIIISESDRENIEKQLTKLAGK